MMNLTPEEINEIENMAIVTESPLDRTIRDLKIAFERGEFDPHPNFQRNPGVWKYDQKTRLIESIILKVKIPRIYMAEIWNTQTTTQEKHFKDEIVDGQQRLTTIFDYINNVFALKGLNRATRLEGARFKDLPVLFQNRILDTTLNVIRITHESNIETKYYMFENLNRGSVGLNKQEFRESYYHSPLVKFVQNLASDVGHFKNFMVNSGFTPMIINRKKPEELVAKALAFHVLRVDVYKNKDQLIGLFYETFKAPVRFHLECPEFKQWHDIFSEACLTINRIFGTRPFCVQGTMGGNKINKKFNEAIYDAYMYAFMDIKDFKLARQNADEIYRATCSLYKNPDFVNSVTLGIFDGDSRRTLRSTADPNKVKLRMEMFKDLLKKSCKDIKPRLPDGDLEKLRQQSIATDEKTRQRNADEWEAKMDQ